MELLSVAALCASLVLVAGVVAIAVIGETQAGQQSDGQPVLGASGRTAIGNSVTEALERSLGIGPDGTDLLIRHIDLQLRLSRLALPGPVQMPKMPPQPRTETALGTLIRYEEERYEREQARRKEFWRMVAGAVIIAGSGAICTSLLTPLIQHWLVG